MIKLTGHSSLTNVGWTVMTVALLLFVASSVAAAQRAAGKPRVIQLEEIRIEGRVQKPNAFYILNRSSLGYEEDGLKTSFVRDVVRSVNRKPF